MKAEEQKMKEAEEQKKQIEEKMKKMKGELMIQQWMIQFFHAHSTAHTYLLKH